MSDTPCKLLILFSNCSFCFCFCFVLCFHADWLVLFLFYLVVYVALLFCYLKCSNGPCRDFLSALCKQEKHLFFQRLTAVQVRSSVWLMPQNQLSVRGLLLSPIAWSLDQHPAAMLADVSPYFGWSKGRGLGFGQLDCTHTGKCLECQSSSDGLSDHSALCAGGRELSAWPASKHQLQPEQCSSWFIDLNFTLQYGQCWFPN